MTAKSGTPEVADADLPPKPIAPEPGDCCGGGCTLCVFDAHEQALERWEREVEEILKRRISG